MDLPSVHRALSRGGVVTTRGLSDRELVRIEEEHSFRFPPDLRAFLGYALPVSPGWVDWRAVDDTELRRRLDWPFEGICFDIEHADFWLAGWGERPGTLAECFEIARQRVSAAPALIPIVGHRYLPARPDVAGNPVLSVHQTDIICYGADLEEFFANELPEAFGRTGFGISREPRWIELWSELSG